MLWEARAHAVVIRLNKNFLGVVRTTKCSLYSFIHEYFSRVFLTRNQINYQTYLPLKIFSP